MSDASLPLIGKRKKKTPVCANPIFVEILTDLRNQSEEKGWNSRYTYAKALKSLKKYPLPIPNGKGCKFLEHFGDKICTLLDDKLPLYESRTHTVTESSVSDDDGSSDRGSQPTESLPVQRDTSPSVAPPRPKKRCSTSVGESQREYIPAYRSGPYAILLALHEEIKSAYSKGYLMKKELIRSAQRHADKSFTTPDPGSHYTAWSSMGTLIRKGLVIKDANPAKYSITAAGINLAEKMESAKSNNRQTVPSSPQSPAQRIPRCTVPDEHQESPRRDVPREAMRDDCSNEFTFSYINNSDEKTLYKIQAKVTIDEEIGVGFLITCRYTDLLHSGKKYMVDVTRPLTEENIYAYIQDSDADDVATPPTISATVAPTASTLNVEPHHSENKESYSHAQKAFVSPVPPRRDETPRVTPPVCLPGEAEFELLPHSFDIVLCVDNREFYGAGSSGGKQLVPGLMKNAVECDLRKLEVGDFVWVAKEKTKSTDTRSLDESDGRRELVLDYVIERKRMDDLVSSCVDGRLKEQKYRMIQSGLRCPIYLIEQYGSMQNFSLSEERLQQTINNIQVIDRFQVKITGDTKESVAYLTMMTRYLQSHFKSKTLRAYDSSVLVEHPQPYDINSPALDLMSFENFNQSTIKTKPLSVREMFGKQLVQMYRMSHDSAMAVLDLYPTVSHLMNAYDTCRSDHEKEHLLSTVKVGVSSRNLGNPLSRQIYQFYYSEGELT